MFVGVVGSTVVTGIKRRLSKADKDILLFCGDRHGLLQSIDGILHQYLPAMKVGAYANSLLLPF